MSPYNVRLVNPYISEVVTNSETPAQIGLIHHALSTVWHAQTIGQPLGSHKTRDAAAQAIVTAYEQTGGV